MRKVLLGAVFLSWCLPQAIQAQERLAVLPLEGIGVEVATLETVYLLLQTEIRDFESYDVVPESEILAILGDQLCSETACAIEIGKQAAASKVVFGSLNRLGEKIIFQYTLVDVASGDVLLSDDLSALRVEDLDQVTKRVAASIVRQIPADQTVAVGLVTEQEAQEQQSRKANSSWGIGFGYLYPQQGYDNEQSIFVWDFRSIYEMRHFAVDALLGFRQGVSLNVGFLYLVGRSDFSPYAGAGLGFHGVSHEYPPPEPDDPYYDDHGGNETSDGVEFLFKAGLLAFRTYDFRVNANVEYSITLNDFDDSGVVVTIGVMRAGKRVFGIF